MYQALKKSCLALVLVITLLVSPLGVSAASMPLGMQKQHPSAQIHVNTCPQLPAQFDPINASASIIHSYYLPPRPQGNALLLAQWVHLIKSIKRLICPSDFVLVHHPITHAMAGRIHPNTPSTSRNWSGYVGNSSGFDDIKGNWATQCLGPHNVDGAEVATWVGIGGVNGNQNLAQTGTDYLSDGYHLFTEFAPGNTYIDTTPLSCATAVNAETYWYAPTNTWCTNISYWNGSYNYNYGTCYPSSYRADTSTADWVDERPLCLGGLALLADFETDSFSNGYAHNAARGWHTIGGWYQTLVTMLNFGNKGATLAQPYQLQPGGTAFFDQWYNAGNGVACY